MARSCSGVRKAATMRDMSIRGFSLAATALLTAAATLFGQGTTSRVLGLVEDPSGAVVAGATIKLTNEGTGVVFTTKSSAAGTYVFDAVQPGAYSLAVEAAGFRRFVSNSNQVTIGQPATVNAKLEVGALAEAVEVTASAEVVQT